MTGGVDVVVLALVFVVAEFPFPFEFVNDVDDVDVRLLQ